ncbi:MAG: ATPase, T2SS/T4P/T4SS family [Actinomycetota bacterium]|nr:ATPase, T2SS/T4P/T4SS family [Actinomycetota bacterium]
MDVLAAVEDRVRDGVRSRGIDPISEPDLVRELVDMTVASVLAEWSADDDAQPTDASDLKQHAFSAVAGFGPLQQYFDDPEIEELWINEPGRVFIARNGRSELTPLVLDATGVRDLVERMLRQSGRRLDLSSPFVDAMLPDGSRLHVAIPDITRTHWAVNVRRFVLRAPSLGPLVDRGMLTGAAAGFLDTAVARGLNIVVAGGTQAGKTTFVNALLGSVPGHERIITCEEVFELRLQNPDFVAMQTRDASLEGTGEMPLRRLVREALRMRPTRLVVGEVRQAEALDLLIAMNSGLPSMATIHANSAREAVTKLCTLPLLAGPNIAADFVVPTVAASVDLVVHVAIDASGVRRVGEICALPGRTEGNVVELVPLFEDRGDGLQRSTAVMPDSKRFRGLGMERGGRQEARA